MHDSVPILQAKAGFVSMTLHSSLDGTRIAVYAQWTSQETLEAAISDPEAVAAYDRMAEIGTSDGSLYTVERVYGPRRLMASPIERGVGGSLGAGPTLTVAPGVDRVTFVNVWTTADAEQQRRLVKAMTAETSLLTSKPSFISMAFLRSTDGAQVVVLAQWDSKGAFDAAITNDETAMVGRRRLEAHGQSSAHMHEVAYVYGPEEQPRDDGT
jgi:heme-degrading monooxygenase HmoA